MSIKCPACGYENQDDALACNLCQQVLRRENQPPKPDFGRRFEGFARYTVLHAAEDPMFSGLGIDLDYSPASLWGVDAALDAAIGTAGDAPDIKEADYAPDKEKQAVILSLGSYYGEVCRRVLGGVWQSDPRWQKDLGAYAELIMARMVFGGHHINPVARAVARYKNGGRFYFFLQLQELAKKLGVPCVTWGQGFIKQAGLILDRGTLPLPERAAALGMFCKLGAGYDPGQAGEIMALTVKLSKLAAAEAPAQRPLPDKRILTAASYILNGEMAFNSGRFTEAMGFYKEALALDPADPRAWKNLAAAQYGAGRFKEALDSLTKSLELAPGDAEALRQQAVVLDRLRRG